MSNIVITDWCTCLVLACILVGAVSAGTFETPLTTYLARHPDAQCIEGELPIRSTFVVTEEDAAFTLRVGDSLMVRNFKAWHNGRTGLLLTRAAPRGAYTASWEVTLNKPVSKHQLWLFEQGRAWSSPIRWRIGDRPWVDGAVSLAMQNYTQIGEDGPTYCWTYLGELSLPRGRYVLEVEVTASRPDGIWMFGPDCFVLTPTPEPGEGPPFNTAREHIPGDALYLYDGTPPVSLVPDDFRPRLDPFLCKDDSIRPAVIICPGGAYIGRSSSEAPPLAHICNDAGMHAFILQYRVFPHLHPAPIVDAARAVRLVRSQAVGLRVDPNRIALCGFSAGGHLAASLAVHADKRFVNAGDKLDSISCRPDALVLVYPVITGSGPAAHRASLSNLLGDNAPAELVALMSPEQQVGPSVPPTFLVHASDDGVSVENSLLFAESLSAAHVPFELHVFPFGGHGFGAAIDKPHLGHWPGLCMEWLRQCAWKTGE